MSTGLAVAIAGAGYVLHASHWSISTLTVGLIVLFFGFIETQDWFGDLTKSMLQVQLGKRTRRRAIILTAVVGAFAIGAPPIALIQYGFTAAVVLAAAAVVLNISLLALLMV